VILARTLDLLASAHDPSRAEFPVRIRAGTCGYQADYGGRDESRYSINCLLGLQEASRQGVEHPSLPATHALTFAFVEGHRRSITRLSDLGLLAALSAGDPSLHDCAAETIASLQRACSSRRSALLTMQDLGWMLWGAVAAARCHTPGADALACDLVERLASRYVVNRPVCLATRSTPCGLESFRSGASPTS